MRTRFVAFLFLLVAVAAAAQTPQGLPAGPEREALLKQRDALWTEAQALDKDGKRREAIAAAEQMLAIERRVFGPAHDEIAYTLEWIHSRYDALGEYATAVTWAEQLLTVRIALDGEKHWRVTNARIALDALRVLATASPSDRTALEAASGSMVKAMQLHEAGRYPEAIALVESALPVIKRLFGEAHPATIGSTSSLAVFYGMMGEYDRSLRLLEAALTAQRSVLGPEHPAIALTLQNIAMQVDGLGDFARAKGLFDNALALQINLVGEDDVTTAQILNNAGLVSVKLGEFAQAETYYTRALTIRRKLLGDAHANTAETLSHLGLLRVARGDYAGARDALKEALATQQQAYQDEHRFIAATMNTLAAAENALGNYPEAERLYQTALDMRRRIMGPQNPETLDSLDTLSLFYISTGDFRRAESLMQQALAVPVSVVPVDHPSRATRLTMMGVVAMNLGDDARARALYEEALAIQRKQLGPDHPATSLTLNNLAVLYVAAGTPELAGPIYQQVLDNARKYFGEEHAQTALALNNVGFDRMLRGDLAGAEEAWTQVVTRKRDSASGFDPLIALTLTNLGALAELQGNKPRAAGRIAEALDIYLRNLDVAAVVQSERQQLSMAQSLRFSLDMYLSLASRDGVAAAAAWERNLAWKGMVLARQRADRAIAGSPELRDKYTELQRLASLLAQAALNPSAAANTEAARKEALELSDRKERLETELGRASVAFRDAIERPSAAAVIKVLPADAVFVDFVEYVYSQLPPGGKGTPLFEARLLAFVVKPDGGVKLVALGTVEAAAKSIDAWREGAGATPESITAGADLRQMIWQPIETVLAQMPNVRQVLVSPDGVLGRMPLGALPGRAPRTYLLEDWPLASISSPQALLSLMRAEKPARPAGNLFGVGGVNYDSRSAPALPKRAFPAQRAARDDDSTFAPLDGTRGELATIEKLYRDAFGDAGIRTLGGGAATEEAVRNEAPRHLYLHLATHGFFAPERYRSALQRSSEQARTSGTYQSGMQTLAGYHPGLLSGLALAGANAPTADDDGILTAEEVATLDLSGVELAVLSACETGLGQVAGGEGLLGLQRAFHTAGARTVIATMWKVDDVATREVMERFYDNLWNKNMGKLAALRDAQLWMLRNRGSRGLKSVGGAALTDRLPPYYWAAFVLSGDWR